ncbi:MAG: TonB family protein [Muribaculum sp.]|nr:TonB family protein [Muribaculum sp.]
MSKLIYMLLCGAVVMAVSCSRSTYKSLPGDTGSATVAATQSDEEWAVQEPAWTYYERLSLALGCDSNSIGISSDMTLPDWYSECFVNKRDRLTINVIGDSLQLRRMLEDMLQGDEFDMGMGLFSWNEQRAVTDSLLKAVERSPVDINMSCSSNVDGTVEVTLEASNDSAIEVFRKEVFDSPLLRFKRADKVGIILEKEEVEVNEKQPEEQSYIDHETLPQFPGGDGAMIKYIYDNLRYPKEAYDENIQGRVVVQFLVDKTGDIDSIKVVKSKDSYLDAEAVRIVRSFPKFTPGTFDSMPVEQWMTLRVMFKKTDYDDRFNTKYPAFQYDNGDDYVRDGLYRIVDERGRIGYADEKGNTVITPRFSFGFPFENGKAKVTDCGQMKEVEGSRGEYHYWESDDWYFIDKSGRKL